MLSESSSMEKLATMGSDRVRLRLHWGGEFQQVRTIAALYTLFA